MKLKYSFLSKINETQHTAYCTIPFIWLFGKGKTNYWLAEEEGNCYKGAVKVKVLNDKILCIMTIVVEI